MTPQPGSDPSEFRRTALAEPESVGALRSYAETVLIKWGLDARIDDVTLAVSELTTNCVRAGRAAGSGQITFRISLTSGDELILIEVTDPFQGRPQLKHATGTDLHGRGLVIVAALSEDMGYRDEPDGGKTTWATLRAHPCPAVAPSTSKQGGTAMPTARVSADAEREAAP